MSTMDNQEITQGSFRVEFPDDITQEEIDWIQNYIFRFLERHSCLLTRIEDEQNNDE
jgi:hypothetical protein